MAHSNSQLKFDHREVAVIFSLFVFVSLLMFTVGILVGKGLAQAKYEGGWKFDRRINESTPEPKISREEHSPGTSVTTSALTNEPATAPKAKDPGEQVAKSVRETTESQSFVPIPQKPKVASQSSSGFLEPAGADQTQHLLKDPKISALIDDEGASPRKRKPASVGKLPGSFASGHYTVQIGSYPTETEAQERVDTLKKLGFPYAHFSAKQLGEKQDTWFRVWLGYFPDYRSADDSGKFLKDRGEVKHYLVRKNENAG